MTQITLKYHPRVSYNPTLNYLIVHIIEAYQSKILNEHDEIYFKHISYKIIENLYKTHLSILF